MKLQCLNCDQINNTPPNSKNIQFRCYYCNATLPKTTTPDKDTSEAVGLIGGAAVGAAFGGPVGAFVGAVIGFVIARNAKEAS